MIKQKINIQHVPRYYIKLAVPSGVAHAKDLFFL